MELVAYPASSNVSESIWQPLSITAHLSEPIAGWREDIGIDGPLSFAAMLEFIDEHGNVLPPKNQKWALDFEIPIAKWAIPLPNGISADPRLLTQDGQVWGWCVSDPQYEEAFPQVVDVRRKPAIEEMSRWSRANRHHIGFGPHKARNVPHNAAFVRSITWYVLGEQEGIERLLKRVKALGRLSRAGNGRVMKWVVEPCDDQNAWKQRCFPADQGVDLPVRAPAWHKSRLVPCL